MTAQAKHVPERTCVACRAKGPKQALLRIVRSAEGSVAFDATGRSPGRGAYVCSLGCLEQAQGRHGLERALRCRLTGEDYARLAQGIADATKQDMRETEV